MKKSLLFLLLALSTVQVFAYKKTNVTVNVNNQDRDVVVFVPNSLPDNSPLMIVTHGMNQSPEYQYDSDKMYEMIDTAKFVVAYLRSDGSTWDTGGTKDQNFVIKTIDKMATLYNINTNRVYWSGFSMGSMLIYHCMANMQDKIAAFAPTSGIQFSESPWNNVKKPVNLIHVHAYGDDVFGYDQYGIRDYVMHFKDVNKCTTYKKTTGYKTIPTAWYNGDKEVWSGGNNGSEVELFSYNNGGHWPMDLNRHEIWNFCKRFSLVSGPKLTSITPEKNSFDMSTETHRTFSITFDKAVNCDKVKGTLARGSQNIALTLAETGESATLTFTVPADVTLEEAAYKLKVSNVESADGGMGGVVEATYTYGIEEVGDVMKVDTILTQDWYSQRDVIGEGIPDGWKRVASSSDGNDTQEQNTPNVKGSRMKYFIPSGKIDAGFYLSAREYSKVEFTYGTYTGKTLILKKGKYWLSFNSTYWTKGAQDTGSTFSVSFINSADKSPVFTEPSLKPEGCIEERDGTKITKCAHHLVECDLTTSAKYWIQFSYASGWNGIILGEPTLTTAPSAADLYKGGFLRTMKKAKEMLDSIKEEGGEKYAEQVAQLEAAINQYDGFTSIAPSEYEAATNAVTDAMKQLEAVGINSVSQSDTEAALYDLSGRRITAPTQRGIYIFNGKKVVR